MKTLNNIIELNTNELTECTGGFPKLPTLGGALIWFLTESLLNYRTVKESFMEGWNDASSNDI